MKKSTLKKLQSVYGESLISVYIPLEKGMNGHKFNQSQLHNVRSELKKLVTAKQHAELSKEIESAIESLGYSNESPGFALFYDGAQTQCFTLPFSPGNTVETGSSYNIDRIKEHYRHNKLYYVLAISKKGTRLYKGDMEKLKIINVSGLGKDLKTTLNIDDTPRSTLQSHTTAAGGRGSTGFHGHGGVKDLKKLLFEDYLRYVDKKILKAIKDKKIPLVLVAVDYGQSAFKHISKYPSILLNGVSTNPDEMSPIELHKRTYPLLIAA